MDGEYQQKGAKESCQIESKCLDVLKMMCCGEKPEHMRQEIEPKVLSEGQQDVQKRDILKKEWDDQCEEYRHLDYILTYLASLEKRDMFIADKETKDQLHRHELLTLAFCLLLEGRKSRESWRV